MKRSRPTTLDNRSRPWLKVPTREQLDAARRLARKVGIKAYEMMRAKPYDRRGE